MGSVCGIPVQSQPEHKVNISVNIPEEVIKKVELKVKEVKKLKMN